MNPKKKAILDTVLKFLTQSEHQKPLTISNIAKDLDIGKSTIYEYFDSKEAMLVDTLSMLIDEIITEIIHEDVIDQASFEESFKHHLKQLFDNADKFETLQEYAHHPDVSKLPKALKQNMIAKMQDTTKDVKHYLFKILDKGLNEGVIEPISDDKLAVIEGMIFGSMFVKSDITRNIDELTLINNVYDALVDLHR